ncbi:hypothetical protein TNCV_2814671 [Trichonephila clavipes]|nr:hypothetical protein TNCV_2814671 [Trichonephila clavipes]
MQDIAVADSRITTGHDCPSKHLNPICIAQSPLCKLCDSNEEMYALHLARHHALSFGSMWSRYWQQNSSPNVVDAPLGYKYDSNDDQRGLAVKRNGIPDHNFWLRASVRVIVKAGSARCPPAFTITRTDALNQKLCTTSSMIVRTQLEARFVAKHYTSPVSMISI